MNFCPREFNSNMTDPSNLAYCHEIQRQEGVACRKKRCPFCVEVEKVGARVTRTEQGRLF